MNENLAQALQLLATGLRPYVRQRLRIAYGADWEQHPTVRSATGTREFPEWDAHIVLLLMWDHWNAAFRSELTFVERSLVSELREVRNRWAHQRDFSMKDVYRCIDSIERLLAAIHSENADAAGRMRLDNLKSLYDSELGERPQMSRDWFTASIAVGCWLLTVGVMGFYLTPYLAIPLVMLTSLVLGRVIIGSLKSRPVINTGPRQCGSCTRVYYGGTCPYCKPARVFPKSGAKKSPGKSDTGIVVPS